MDNLQNEGTVLPPIWAYFSFNRTTGRSMCKICKKTMNGRQFNELEAHLKRHPTYMKKISAFEKRNVLRDVPALPGTLPLPFTLAGMNIPRARPAAPTAPILKNRNSRNSKDHMIGLKREFQVWDEIFRMQDSNSDVHLICGDGVVPAHAFILQYASSFIDSLFTAMGENYTEIRKILLPDFNMDFVQRTIELVYSGSTNVSSRAEADSILEILDTLRIDRKNISLHHAIVPGEEPVVILFSSEPEEPMEANDEITADEIYDVEAPEEMDFKIQITDVRGASVPPPPGLVTDADQDFSSYVVPKIERIDEEVHSPPHTEFQVKDGEPGPSSSMSAPKRRTLRSRAKLLSQVSYQEPDSESESGSSSSSSGVEFIKSTNRTSKNSPAGVAPNSKKRKMAGAPDGYIGVKSDDDEEYTRHSSPTPPSSESSDTEPDYKTPKLPRTRQKVNKVSPVKNARVSALYVKAVANLQQKAANSKPRITAYGQSGRVQSNNQIKRDSEIRKFWGPHPAASVKNTNATASLKALSSNAQFRGSNSNRTQQIPIPNLSGFMSGNSRKPGIGIGFSIPGLSSGIRPLTVPRGNLSRFKNGGRPILPRPSIISSCTAPSMSNTIQDIMSNLRSANSSNPVLEKQMTAAGGSMLVRPIAMPVPTPTPLPLPIPEIILPDTALTGASPSSGNTGFHYRDPQLFREDAKMCGKCKTKYTHIKQAADCIKRHRLVRCYFCFALFDTTETLFKHYAETHGSRCPICEEPVLFQQASMHAISKHLFESSDRNAVSNVYNRNLPDHRIRLNHPIVKQITLEQSGGQSQGYEFTVENPIVMAEETGKEFATGVVALAHAPTIPDPNLIMLDPNPVVKVEYEAPEEAETFSFEDPAMWTFNNETS